MALKGQLSVEAENKKRRPIWTPFDLFDKNYFFFSFARVTRISLTFSGY